ncbi:uncharacterized protein conserved in bacteria [Hahella chejuensis KCTC 2396]|uniref:Ancillary SecYEG translocon subunit n=1 Tax=Hahella chejuensis (strain KCTC 2396) TaxID=349521 RepID=Q2SDW6_HAHCH|nr:tetratricopeptide repeat protein [Hahella chejuensis]ABC31158.1 uncharacterized protein conserved in bacteria [Hahella chejuensis KCTC 2396]
MDSLRTEEEQIAAIKNWWKENGNALLIGIGLALAAIFGWKAYNQNELQKKEEASQMYQELVQAAGAAQMADDEKSQANITFLATELQSKFPGTTYALYAKLYEAQQAVAKKDFAGAETALKAVASETEDEALKRVVSLRLARVLAAQQKFDDALAALKAQKGDVFYSHFQELAGDILKMKGSRAEAKAAYEQALADAKEHELPTELLQIKLNDLADV